MRYTRTPTTSATPVSLAELKAYMRIDHADEDVLIVGLGATAAAEIEAYCDLAILAQTITAICDDPASVIVLPVGPVQAGATVTVEAIAEDGSATALTGFWLEAGRYPRLTFTTTPTTPLRITYPAGFVAVPVDLAQAICDHSARLYDQRGDDDVKQGLSTAAARIAGRYRRVAL